MGRRASEVLPEAAAPAEGVVWPARRKQREAGPGAAQGGGEGEGRGRGGWEGLDKCPGPEATLESTTETPQVLGGLVCLP